MSDNLRSLQAVVATIWEKAFERSPIDLDENFFDLGGHSLTATRINAEINRTLRSNIPLSLHFEHLTVRELSEALASHERARGIDLEAVAAKLDQDLHRSATGSGLA